MRQAHPHDHLASLDPDFIGLHLHKVELALLHQRLVHLLTLLACPIPPARYRALIQPKGVDNGLHWTAIGQQRHHCHDHLRWLAQSCKHRALLCTERFPAGLASVTWSLVSMTHDIALPDDPSCLTVQVRAKYLGGIHLLCGCLHMHSLQTNPLLSSLLGLLSTS